MNYALFHALVVSGLLMTAATGRPVDPSETIEQDDQYVEQKHQQDGDNLADEAEVMYEGAGGDGLPDYGGLRPVDVDAGVFPVEQQAAVPVQSESQPIVQQLPVQQPMPTLMQIRDRSLEQYLMERMDNRLAGMEAHGQQFGELLKKMHDAVSSVSLFLFFADFLLLAILILVAYGFFSAMSAARRLQMAEKAAHDAHADEMSRSTAAAPTGSKLGTA